MPLVRIDQLQQFAAIDLRLDPGAIGGPVIIPSCAQISFLWTQDSGVVARNILYGRYSGPFAGTPTQCDAIHTALTTGAAWTALAAHLASTSSFVGVNIRDVAIPNQALIGGSGPAVPGTSSGTPLPNEVAVCVTLRTANAGRAGRGRLYVPNFASTALGATNTINAAAVTAVNNWAATITGALNASGYIWVLALPARQAYTGSTGTPHPARAATSVPITSASVRDNHWDSQRRRGLR